MSEGRRLRQLSLAPFTLLAVAAAGCGRRTAPQPAIIPQVVSVPSPVTPGETPRPAPRPAAATASTPPAAATGGIEMSIRHVQLFHPYSRSRSMDSVDTPGRPVANRFGGNGHFGLGVIFEAVNRTGFMLGAAHLAGAITFDGAHGSHGCEVPTAVQEVSLDPTSTRPWRNESPYRSVAESVWRPLETIRFGFRADCGPALLLDTDIQHIRGQFTVTADPHYNEGHFTSTEATFSLPGRAAVLQVLRLPDGTTGFGAGDLFIRRTGEGVGFDSLGAHVVSATVVQRTELPATAPVVEEHADEFTLRTTSAELTHWADGQNIPKGRRALFVRAQLSLATAAIRQRLQGAVDAAQAAQTQAAAAATTARTHLAAMQADPAHAADVRPAAADAHRAEGAERAATHDLAAAQSGYQRGLAGEHTRLARLLDCGRMRLVTTAQIRPASNAREAATACAALTNADQTEVSWVWLLDRYEVQVGLLYALGGESRFSSIASVATSRLDAR